ncbi:MAG: hypothetical protein IJD28_08215 [Deferribacterales bacterium]|nr:hypothetical protein [Deferribacterales bacterium]
MGVFEQFTDWAKANKWHVRFKKTPSSELNLAHEIIQRYGPLPPELTGFFKKTLSLSTKGKTAWFLCEDDYAGAEDSGYSLAWNEAEVRSLDAALGDSHLMSDIKAWWDKRLPIVLSNTDSQLTYYAYDCNNGYIICGHEPNFEDTHTVASSFEDFLQKIIQGKISL